MHGKQGISYNITSLSTKKDAQRFFIYAGLKIGDRLTLIHILSGHYIVLIKGKRFALDTSIAKEIQIKAS